MRHRGAITDCLANGLKWVAIHASIMHILRELHRPILFSRKGKGRVKTRRLAPMA